MRRLAEAGHNASQIAPSRAVPALSEHPSCERCGHAVHDFDGLPRSEYALLLGFYLGDGTISSGARGVFRLRIVNDNRYSAVTAECALSIGAVLPRSRVGLVQKVGCVEIGSYSKAWPCLLPYYGPGLKHEQRIVLTDWQRVIVRERPHQFVRGLLLSDGCRVTNFATTKAGRGRYEYARYHFSNASADIRELFCSTLEALGIHYTLPKERDVSIATRRGVAYLDRFVGPKA